jgi:hypothetical protein
MVKDRSIGLLDHLNTLDQTLSELQYSIWFVLFLSEVAYEDVQQNGILEYSTVLVLASLVVNLYYIVPLQDKDYCIFP